MYTSLIQNFGTEFNILLHATLVDIEQVGSKQLAVAIDRVRRGEIYIQPGYDGEFGVVKVFRDGELRGRLMQGALSFD